MGLSRVHLVVAEVAAVTTVSAGLAGPTPVITPLWLEGDVAPGTGAFFQNFDRPNVAEHGAVAFAGDTDGPGASDDVVYLDDVLVAWEGQPAPGTTGSYRSFEFFETTHQVNVAGDVVYIATLTDVPAGQDRAVFRSGTLVAWSGTPAPGIPERRFDDFGFAGVTDGGAVGFLGDLDGPTSGDSVIVLDGAVVYREGDLVGAALPEATWDGNFDELQWNGAGDLLFEGNTSAAPDDLVVFRRRADGTESVVVREGQAVPPANDTLSMVLQTALAEDGAWAVRAVLTDAPSDESAIILSESGFFAREGTLVTEFLGVRTGDFNAVDINARGDVVYLADLVGPAPDGIDEGIFVNGELLITDGIPVPGLPDGTMLSDLGFEDVTINDDRTIVFQASYSGAVSGDGIFSLALESCPADVDASGNVDFEDVVEILSAWGRCQGCPADVDEDGVVGLLDLVDVLDAWGPC